LIHGGRLLRTLQYIAVRSAHMQDICFTACG